MDLLACTPALGTICELLALIDTRSLRNFCLTNSYLNKLCRIYLVYRWSNSKHCPEPSIKCFALHLQKHPELRTKVKIVDFGVLQYSPQSESGSSTNSNYDPKLVSLAEELRPDIDYESLYDKPALLEDIKGGCEDAIAVVILAWCKRITHLNMTIPEFDINDPQSFNVWCLRFVNEIALQNELGTSNLPLAQLHYVELIPRNPEVATYWELVTPFIHLPSVKSLAAWRLSDAEPLRNTWLTTKTSPDEDDDNYSIRYFFNSLDRISNVEELILKNSGFFDESRGLSDLLCAPCGLKKLTLWPCNDHEFFNFPSRDELAEDIISCHESLEELDLNFDRMPRFIPHGAGTPPLRPDPVAVKAYRRCTRLRRLACPMVGLFSDGRVENGNETSHYEMSIVLDRLPKSIEYLKPRRRHFYSDRPTRKPFIDGFIELLRQATPGGRLPNLTVLDFTDTFVDDPETEGIDEMKELAKKQGVKLLLAQRQICGNYSSFLKIIFCILTFL
ncbi:uncharacterized protein FIESC28_07244 [Fusarium coffeatum]|uniref:F-box domain-containing protein n=1 Tax=Fusarium coffeatum TaxID=231269 RepID=A0A366REN0_9HYPO|nr:uncharacterized protein FIESC28_07244 [Fusarium coffeatum]RBR15603.1 hypothetical protein FIESC28_07244 [Fusarium coffeatum]